MLSLIAAMDRNRVIGRNGALPWYLPADFEHFKRLTGGHAIIMGRKTHESIGRELPGRKNIIVTRQKSYRPHGDAVVAHSITEAVMLAGEDPEIFIIGGADIYAQSISIADRMYISQIDGEFDGDAHFPEIGRDWRQIEHVIHKADEANSCNIHFLTYERTE